MIAASNEDARSAFSRPPPVENYLAETPDRPRTVERSGKVYTQDTAASWSVLCLTCSRSQMNRLPTSNNDAVAMVLL